MAISQKNSLNFSGQPKIGGLDATEAALTPKAYGLSGAQLLGIFKGNCEEHCSYRDIADVGRHFIYTEINAHTSNPAGVWTVGTTAGDTPPNLPNRLIITTAGNADDGAQIQKACAQTSSTTSAGTSTAFAGVIPRTGNIINFHCRFQITSTITNAAFIIGLVPVDTTILATSAIGVTDLIGFYKTFGAATGGVLRKSSSSTTTTLNTANSTPVISTWYDYQFKLNGTSSIDYFINGVKTSSSTMSNIPVVGLTPSIAFTNHTGAAGTIWVQSLACFEEAY